MVRLTRLLLISLERLYEEAGIILSNSVVRRFDEVRRFHESIIANRRSYLGSEVIAARQRIRDREEQMMAINDRRVKNHGYFAVTRSFRSVYKIAIRISRTGS